jgi:mono/diheme cytochrome c family protein
VAGGTSVPSPARRYLQDRTFRRATLVASLVNSENDYSRLRLRHYGVASADSWDALPEWNPRTAAVDSPADLEGPLPADAAPLAIPSAAEDGDPAALTELGERAFFRYPVQLLQRAGRVLARPGAAERLGVWRDPQHGLGSLVEVELSGSPPGLAMTCATCHAEPGADGRLRPGLANHRLDLGRLLLEGAPDLRGARAALLASWGPGRLDVSTTEGTEPVRIPDLRPTRFLTHLHADATVAQNDVYSLAIRIETLLITAHQRTVRPPRVVTLALATYLWSLGPSGPPPAPTTAGAERGRERYQERCQSCHAPPGMTGPPVTLARVGTDPTLGRSRDRGTGHYRVPSLRGVAARGLLLHDGSVASLPALLDPARKSPGHRFGYDLDDDERGDLIAYLRTL